jgi:hypothetical protein
MISGRYVRYRGLMACILGDFFDALRNIFRRKKKEDPAVTSVGYRKWINLDEGGGVNAGLPAVGKWKEKEKEKKKGDL